MTARRALAATAVAVLTATATAACGSLDTPAATQGAPASSAPGTQPSSATPSSSQPPSPTEASSTSTAPQTEVPAESAPSAVTPLPSAASEPPLQTVSPTETEETTDTPAPTSASSTATPSPATTPPRATASPSSTPAPARMLSVGDHGPDVKALQEKLLARGFWVPSADGDFGALTQQAVFAAQKTFGLPRTGNAGPMTMKALASAPEPSVTVSGTGVEINVARQTFTLVRGGKIQAILNTSTGNGETFYSQGVKYIATTPAGTFTIQSRNPNDWVHGPLGDMYKPAFFNGGIAFHGSAEIPPYPASHGCARLSRHAQDYVWRQGYAAVGATVVVR